MTTTRNLQLDTWDEGSTQPYLPFNELLTASDALIQCCVEAITASPPDAPDIGKAWIVASSPTGVWADHVSDIAVAVEGGWVYYTPGEGWEAYVRNGSPGNYQFLSGAWTLESAGGITEAPIDGQQYARQNGDWSVVEGGGGEATSFVGCRAENNGTQFIPSGNSTIVSFNTDIVDTDAIHDASGDPTHFVVPAGMGGLWRISYKWMGTAGGTIYGFVRKNGATDAQNLPGAASGGPNVLYAFNSFLVNLVAGDVLALWIFSSSGTTLGSSGDPGQNPSFEMSLVQGPSVAPSLTPVALQLAASDEGTALTTGTRKLTFRMPYAMTLTSIRASLTTAASSGLSTFDVNMNGSSLLSTKVTIDATENTSTSAATPAVLSSTSLLDDAEITVDIDGIGTGATGLKISLIGTKP